MTTYTKFDSCDLNALRGDTATYTFSLTTANDFDAYTVIAQGREFENDSVKVFDIGISSRENSSDFSIGKFVMKLPATLTASMPALTAYDVQATNGTDVTTIVRGLIKLFKDVARV